MHIVISPAKSLDLETPVNCAGGSQFRFPDESQKLVKNLYNYSIDKLSELMKISQKLAELNFMRFKEWEYPFEVDKGKPAMFAFKGEVYVGLDAYALTQQEVDYIQNKLRILSGLYGLLRPLDMILPYRLEMGTMLQTGRTKNLYEFWGSKITD